MIPKRIASNGAMNKEVDSENESPTLATPIATLTTIPASPTHFIPWVAPFTALRARGFSWGP